MLFLLAFFAPIVAGLLVYRMFSHDLHHANSSRKLKRGAAQNLIMRHRNAAIIHLLIYMSALIASLILFGTLGIIIAILWTFVFIGHMNAVSRFINRLMATFKEAEAYNRLSEEVLDNTESYDDMLQDDVLRQSQGD